MSPELRAFIDSIKRSTTEDSRTKTEPLRNLLRGVVRRAGALFALIADALEDMGPYAGELRAAGKFESAVAKRGSCGDVIGYHGLA